MAVALCPPGPKGHWLKGNLAEFRRDMLGFFSRCARTYGDVAAFRLGPKQLFLLSHPEAIEQVLVSDNRNFAKHYILQWLRPVLGNGLLLSEGDEWLRQRRLIQPAFHRQRIEAYGDLMVAHARRLAAAWQDGETRDLHADMTRLALGIAAEALLGVAVADQSGDVGQALEQLMQDFSGHFGRLLPIPRWLPTPRKARVKQAVRRLDAIIHGIIAQRRRAAEERGDLLSALVRARDEDDGRGMTDRQLRDEVMTLFLAGHETTANALAWTWYLLAQHPAVEARLLAELRAVLGDRPPGPADLPRLVYAERVVLEAMRLYPPVYAFGRQALRECEIGGYAVPAGTTLIMSQWVVHRDERYFDHPEDFAPDRWADGLARRLPKYAYFPFGGGPRVCIGNGFAMLELVLVVATLASRFRFQLVPGHEVKPWPSVTLRPAQGIRAILTKR